MRLLVLAALGWLGVAAGSATAASYHMDLTVGGLEYFAYNHSNATSGTAANGSNNLTAIGTIETNGTLGALAVSDILSWSIAITSNGLTQTMTHDLGSVYAPLTFAPGALFAQQDGLYHTFGSAPGGSLNFNNTLDGNTSYFVNGVEKFGTLTSLVFGFDANTGPNIRAYNVLDVSDGLTGSVRHGAVGRQGYAAGSTVQVAALVGLAVVPLPAAGLLYGGGLFGVGFVMRRRRFWGRAT